MAIELDFSKSTVLTELHEMGFNYKHFSTKPDLTPDQIKKRLTHCEFWKE